MSKGDEMNSIKEKYLREKLTQIEIQPTQKEKIQELNYIIDENNRTIHHWINTALFILLFLGLIITQAQGIYYRDNIVITPQGQITNINGNNAEYLNLTLNEWRNTSKETQKEIAKGLK